MSDQTIPDHVMALFKSCDKCAPDCAPIFVEYELFLCPPSTMDPDSYIVCFLPKLQAIQGFELYIPLSFDSDKIQAFYSNTCKYVKTKKYEGKYFAIQYPENVEQFVRGLFEDIYLVERPLDKTRQECLRSIKSGE